MQYETEFKNTKTKEQFITQVLINYPNAKTKTVLRRYYDLRKQQSNHKVIDNSIDILQPDLIKIHKIEDMKKYKIKTDRDTLLKYGFNNLEINWLIKERYVK